MTETEFKTWLKSFYALFRSVETYHERLGGKRGETLRAWFDCLSLVSFDHATEAARRLFSGDEVEPKSFDLFPGVIRRICEKLAKARYVEQPKQPMYAREDVRECRMCFDQGNACQVYSRHAIELVKDEQKLRKALRKRRIELGDRTWLDLLEGVEPNKLMVHHPVHVIAQVTNVICTCRRGDRCIAAQKQQGYKVPVQFNPQEMFPTYKRPLDPDILREFYWWCMDTRAVPWDPEHDYEDVTQEAF